MAITRFDAEMLQNSIQNTGEQALKRNALAQQHEQEMARLAIESQLRDVQQKRYEAQAAHFQGMEDIGTERNQILAQTESDRNKIAEQGKIAAQQYADSLAGMKEFVQTLRANRIANQKDPSQGLPQDQATKMFQESMDALPDNVHQQMLSNPQYGGLYKGAVDFSTIPALDKNGDPVQQTAANTDTETTEQTIPGTPDTVVPGATHWFKPNEPDTTIPGTPPKKITTIRKVPRGGLSTPPPAAAAPAVNPDAIASQVGVTPATQVISGMVPVQHPNGQTGMIPRQNLAAALQAGYKQIGAPQVAVPGMGSAQDETDAEQ